MERVVFKYTFNFIRDNKSLTPLQSGFVPGDSTINQLLNIYHLLCDALDKKKDVRIVFCDISKAFDRVWHKGLLYKLHRFGIKGDLLQWYGSYLQNRCQRVVLGNATSDIGFIKAGVPQGSVLGPLLFLVSINDITENLSCNIRLFADDTTLFIDYESETEATNKLNVDLNKINAWANRWLVTFSPSKTETLLVSLKRHDQDPQPVVFDNTIIKEVKIHKHLGMTLSNDLSWNDHIDDLLNRAGKRIDILSYLKYRIDRFTLEIMYKSYIRPTIEYGDVIMSNMNEQQIQSIESVHKRAGMIISGAIRGTSSETVLGELGWCSISKRREIHKLVLFYKIFHHEAPRYLSEAIPGLVHERTNYNLRNAVTISILPSRLQLFYESFYPSTIRDWNMLPPEIRNLPDSEKFRIAISKNLPTPNALYRYGARQSNVTHARMRMGCSELNAHLFRNHVIDSPACACGDIYEDAYHYLFVCPRYLVQRDKMITAVCQITSCTIGCLLYGSNNVDIKTNIEIFEHVHRYISETKRFRTK